VVLAFLNIATAVSLAVQVGLDALGDKIFTALDVKAESNAERLDRLGELITEGIDERGLVSERALALLREKIVDRIDSVDIANQDVIAAIGSKLTVIPNAIGDGVDDILDALQEKVVGPIDAVLASVQEQADVLITSLGGLLSVVLEQITGVLSSALEPLQTLAGTIGTGVTEAFGSFVPNLVEFLAPDAWERVKGLVEDFESTPDLPEGLKALTAPGQLPLLGAGAVLLPIIAFAALSAVISATLGPWGQNVTANVNRKARPMRLQVGDAIRARRRGFMTAEQLGDELAQVGYSDARTATLQSLDAEQLQVQETLSLWLREAIDLDEAVTRLEKLGFTVPDIEHLQTLAFPIPGVQDLITMAVREVFSPEIAEKFGQFEEIPDAYLEWTKKQGLTAFWARNIWAAHWVLPSMQMGFQMLHRGVIDEDTLDNLFVAQDVMPFWRDRIAQIAFRPFTRVDIRRMHSANVLTDDEVFTSYKELGYNEEKARAQQLFTLRITAAQRAPRANKERDLTRADILSLMSANLIPPEEAFDSLVAINYDDNEAGLLIARAQIKMITRDRSARKELIFDKFKVGIVSFDVAQDSLVEMGLTLVELEQAQTDLITLRERRITLPTKANFDAFFKAGLITSDEYREGLALLGYAEHWIELYSLLVEATGPNDAAPEEG